MLGMRPRSGFKAALLTLLAVPALASADEDRSAFEGERIEAAGDAGSEPRRTASPRRGEP